MPRQYTLRIPCVCQACGRDFAMPPAEHRKSGGRFCSWACRYGRTPEERFWDYVDKDDPSGCWIWTGGKDQDGYGIFSIGKSSPKAHRFAWQLATGVIPDGVIGHTCDVPQCQRNDDTGTYLVLDVAYERHGHLWLGTLNANMQDCLQKGRRPAGDDHVYRKHPELHVRGERAANAKLNADQAMAIYRATGRQVDIAADYGVDQATVSAIKTGLTWSHVTGHTKRPRG